MNMKKQDYDYSRKVKQINEKEAIIHNMNNEIKEYSSKIKFQLIELKKE